MTSEKVNASDRWIEVAATLFTLLYIDGMYQSTLCTRNVFNLSILVPLFPGCCMMGCFAFAEAKGCHGALGLLGTICIVGMIPIVRLSDRCKQRAPSG